MNFSNLSDVATYRLISQTMNFDNLSTKNLNTLLEQIENKKYETETMKSACHIIHEGAHYFDNLATLSGQRMLVKAYNALNELEVGNGNKCIVEFFNTVRSWDRENYVNVEVDVANPHYERWAFRNNIGFGTDIFDQFSSEFFLFSVFKYQGETVGNVPFSIESLWETNAMWAEIVYHVNVVMQIEDKDTVMVELPQIQKKYTDYLYNSKTLKYSYAAHLTSSYLNLGDFYRAFSMSKALASISLNLPYRYYSLIKRPKGKAFGEFSEVLLDNTKYMDPCVIFLVLLENIYEAGTDGIFIKKFLININKILELSGLPNVQHLNVEVAKEIEQLEINFTDTSFAEEFYKQKEMGLRLFSIYGFEGGLNIHPACFIDIASRSEACVFQADEDVPDSFIKQDNYHDLYKRMQAIIEELKQNQLNSFE